MAKFKVGDIVIGNEKNHYGITARGVKCEVVKVYTDGYIGVKTRGFAKTYDVRSDWFDLVNDEITITRHGNKVVAKYGKKVGVTKCSPEDEFNFAVSAKLAFNRLMEFVEPTLESTNDFDWDGFKAEKFFVKCTKDNFDSFIAEAKKHDCRFVPDENFNTFATGAMCTVKLFMELSGLKTVDENEVLVIFSDEKLFVDVAIPSDRNIVTW